MAPSRKWTILVATLAIISLTGLCWPAHSYPLNLAEEDIKKEPLKEGDAVPNVQWVVREKRPDGSSTTVHQTSDDVFKGKRVLVIGVPGAFTPTCTDKHLPQFEDAYEALKSKGIDGVYCVSVNDHYVMNAWKDKLGIKNIRMIPDVDAKFTNGMGFLVDKSNKYLGWRSWRYAMVVDNGIIKGVFPEAGRGDNVDDDPYENSTPDAVLEYLNSVEDE